MVVRALTYLIAKYAIVVVTADGEPTLLQVKVNPSASNDETNALETFPDPVLTTIEKDEEIANLLS
jgi:hypothetical protein